jgi:hypothetical protein
LPADTQVQIVGNMVADRLANHMVADFTYPSRGKAAKAATTQWRQRLGAALARLAPSATLSHPSHVLIRP